jgi:hypothetical protein
LLLSYRLEGRTTLTAAATGSTDATVGLTGISTGCGSTGTRSTFATGCAPATFAARGRSGLAAVTGVARQGFSGNLATGTTATDDRDRAFARTTGAGVHLVAALTAGRSRARAAVTTLATGGTVTTLAALPTGTAVTTVGAATTRVTTAPAVTARTSGVGQRGTNDKESGTERQHEQPEPLSHLVTSSYVASTETLYSPCHRPKGN